LKNSITIPVSNTPWSETEKQWLLLVKPGYCVGAWSTQVWFPKSICTVEPGKHRGESVWLLTMPKWLYDKKSLQNILHNN